MPRDEPIRQPVSERLSVTLLGSLGVNEASLVNSNEPKTYGSPRKGGPKEARLNRVRLMDTGRYFEACVAREERLKEEFEPFGPLGDIYRPVNKDTKQPLSFIFVRFLNRADMLDAMRQLQGKIIDGRKMIIEEAKSHFELETSIY